MSKNNCFKHVAKKCFRYFKKQETKKEKFKNKKKMLLNYLIPLSFWINEKSNQYSNTYFLGLSGGQGAGKTTITSLLNIILTSYFKKKVCIFSIDDFYKTLNDRKKLSKKIHPLLKTRGVPGTHDIKFIINYLKKIKLKKNKVISLPIFDKSIDDRAIKSKWKKINYIPDIIILEGWCVGAKPQSNKLLNKAVNILEKKEDLNFKWRNYVNKQLKNKYKYLFNKMNDIIYMKVPNFSSLQKWRLKQENKLRLKNIKKKFKIMTNSEVLKFMMTYQRVTQQMFKDLPKIASIVLNLNKNHQIKNIRYIK